MVRTMKTNPKENASRPAVNRTHSQSPDPERSEHLKLFLEEYRKRTKRLPKGDGDLQWLYEVRSNSYLPDFSENNVDEAAENDPETAG